jgi:hypothetical protein
VETNVVRALLAAYPAAATTQDGENTYPLHAAVEDGCPLEIVNALLKADKRCVQLKVGLYTFSPRADP